MTKLTERSYGPLWAAKSQLFKQVAGFRCEYIYADGSRCGVTEGLNSHHNSYDNFRNESFADITVLCRYHHEKIHDLLVIDSNAISATRASDNCQASGESLADELKREILQSGLTHYALGKLSDVSPSQIDRFAKGHRDLNVKCAGRLMKALGLRLTK